MDDVIETYLKSVLKRIEPTAAQRSSASASHNRLRDLLNGGRYGNRLVRSYLSGSYARHTAVRPIDDVDIIFEIDPQAWHAGWFRQFPKPEAVINSFAGAVRRRYPNSSLRRQRRSICLQLNHLNIDLVPAIPDEARGTIWIPDRDQDQWLSSAPKLHAAATTAANRACSGIAVPAIKLLKQWNYCLPSTTTTKSFVMESLAVHVLTARPVGTVSDALLVVWDYLAGTAGEQQVFEWWKLHVPVNGGWGGLTVPDTGGQGGNVAGSVDSAHLGRLALKARIARDKVLAARRARTTSSARQHVQSVLAA